MFTERILDSVKKYFEIDAFTSYKPGADSELEQMGALLAKMRLAGEDRGPVTELVTEIAKQHAATLTIPDKKKYWHLLTIAHHFAALGELFGINLLPLIRPTLLEGLQEFVEVKAIYDILGPNWPQPGSDARGTALSYYCLISHFAQVDISGAFPRWRSAVVEHLNPEVAHGMTEEGWRVKLQKEMEVIDGIIADYKPLPGSRQL